MSADIIKKKLRRAARKEKALVLQRFFKTGPGEYGEGDVFLGVMVPEIRWIVKEHRGIALKEVAALLESRFHEERLAALLILVLKFPQENGDGKKDIYRFYLKHTPYINSWDLVDLSAHHIVGAFLKDKPRRMLYSLAGSKSLWERRIAMLATFHYIRNNDFKDALNIAEILLSDNEDLIHKATGWMLREIGKRDVSAEEEFLKKHCDTMPRVMLRYAIERFPKPKRSRYLKIIIAMLLSLTIVAPSYAVVNRNPVKKIIGKVASFFRENPVAKQRRQIQKDYEDGKISQAQCASRLADIDKTQEAYKALNRQLKEQRLQAAKQKAAA